uniref:Uncharacterized protein n=1 Tax=Oryza brachyantha TaxID=4533 RepID=J3MDZ6_ORYBR
MAIKDRFSGNPEGLTRTNHKPEWATRFGSVATWFNVGQRVDTIDHKPEWATSKRQSRCQKKVVPKVEVRCLVSYRRTGAFVAEVVINSFRSSVKAEESSSARGEESDLRFFKRRSQVEAGVVQESSFISSAVAAAFEP